MSSKEMIPLRCDRQFGVDRCSTCPMAHRHLKLRHAVRWLRYLEVVQRVPTAVLTSTDVAGSPSLERHFSKKAKKSPKPTKDTSFREILANLSDTLSLDEAENRMKASVAHLKSELANIRSGRATPNMLDHMTVEAPSGTLPLRALGTVTVRDAHVLSISLFDVAACPAVLAAIESSPLRLEGRHINDQELLVTLPRQTQETLEALTKLVGREAEQSKTSVRAARKLGVTQVKQLSSEDDQKRGEKAVNALTEAYVAEIEDLCMSKKRELHST